MRKLALLLGFIACVLGCVAPAAAACHVRARQRVVLFGTGDDPGVLLWDSRFRLRSYHLASLDEAQAMLPRALLASAGTRAVVLRCIPSFVQPRYGLSIDNAVYVRILRGPLSGDRGWVLGDDVRDGS